MTGIGAMTDDAPRGSILVLRERMGEAIIGQRAVIDRLLIGLLSNGNLLVEGLPGTRQDALDQGPGEQPGV
jgi:MoxR-like ATPase